MRKQYSDAFIEQALITVYSRGDRTIESVANEVNVGYRTLKNWVNRYPKHPKYPHFARPRRVKNQVPAAHKPGRGNYAKGRCNSQKHQRR
ncbi:transposase [Massilia sp. TSP1-1-2]|uniref:transposase n=1 Tax=Massilia sp. TSP1-1-2 TaxID=2804649 RepID=UPI003CE72FB1